MRLWFLILPVVFVILAGTYYYFYLKRMAAVLGMQTKAAGSRAVIALAAVLLVAPASDIWGIWAVVILYHLVLSLCVDVINAIIKRSRKEGRIWRKLYRSGILPLAALALILGYGYWNMRHVRETDYTVYTDKAIRSEGYRVCLISDLHYGITLDGEELAEYCEKIGEARPDLLVLCGDIVDENTTKEQMQEVFQILGQTDTAYGTYYVYGNHDRGLYSADADFTPQELEAAIGAAGIRILVDERLELNEELTLIGQEDRTNPGKSVLKTPEELLEGADQDHFLLLLEHQPRNLVRNEAAGYDLQLSGHTHGGQIWPVGEISDLLGFGELNYGYRKSGRFQVIVSSGMAGWNYPIRTGAHSEYVMVDILPQTANTSGEDL